MPTKTGVDADTDPVEGFALTPTLPYYCTNSRRRLRPRLRQLSLQQDNVLQHKRQHPENSAYCHTMQPATPSGSENSTNPYGYDVVSMDGEATAISSSPRSPLPPNKKRRRYQRRNSKTPAMLRFASSAPLLVRLDMLEDEKDEVQELFMNTSFFAACETSSSSINDTSFSSELSNSWSSFAIETAEELVVKVKSASATSKQQPPKRKNSLGEGRMT